MSGSNPVVKTNKQGYSGTGTAEAVAAPITTLNLSTTSVIVQSSINNQGTLYIGFETGQPFELAAGDVITIDINNPVKVYVRGADQDYNWLAVGNIP